jgi:hypothetical protein
MAFGRLVVATTTTLLIVALSPTVPASEPSLSISKPSMIVSNVATTRFSTSPPLLSSRRGHRASISSRTTMHGLWTNAR